MTITNRPVVFCFSFFLLLSSFCALHAHADAYNGILREAGVHLSLERATHGGDFVESSPAQRLSITGLGFAGFARLGLRRWQWISISLQPEIAYLPRGTDIELDGAYLGGFRMKYLGIPILARIDGPVLGPIVPYAVTGPTMSYLLSVESLDSDRTSSGRPDGIRSFDVSLVFGAGASVRVTKYVVLTAEVRHDRGFLSLNTEDDSEILNRTLLFTLGVGVVLGAPARGLDPDPDRDGILGPHDVCPHRPEDLDGFKDTDGCPDTDNDGDGFLDDDDGCPDQAEDDNDFQQEDGCPEPDTDGDGFLNGVPTDDPIERQRLDMCPNEAEIMNGFKDNDGCPEPDADGDGIVDALDRCPEDATSMSSLSSVSSDGCIYDGLRFVSGSIEIAKRIKFQGNQLERDTRSLLEELARLLANNPELRMRIAVSEKAPVKRRSKQQNRVNRWSQRIATSRANAIVRALRDLGIDNSRLTAVGKLDQSAPSTGKADDTTVEFIVE